MILFWLPFGAYALRHLPVCPQCPQSVAYAQLHGLVGSAFWARVWPALLTEEGCISASQVVYVRATVKNSLERMCRRVAMSRLSSFRNQAEPHVFRWPGPWYS
jgi:hypothetical protein